MLGPDDMPITASNMKSSPSVWTPETLHVPEESNFQGLLFKHEVSQPPPQHRNGG